MLHLVKITEENVWLILKLRVSEEQKEFVAPNDISLIEAYVTVSNGGQALPYGIYDGDTPIGFLMIGYGCDGTPYCGADESRNSYSLWRFMIDEKYQHKGYGRMALTLALDFIKTFPCGPATLCYLSYEPENTVAKSLYSKFGFKENGEFDEGEAIAVLTL